MSKIERYCIEKGCPGGDGCLNSYRKAEDSCPFEYVAQGRETDWQGDGPPPRRWTSPSGVMVYRTYADYVDD